MHSNIFRHVSPYILSCAELEKEKITDNYENIPNA